MSRKAVIVSALLAGVCLAQPKKEDPVGLVVMAGGGKLMRGGTETAVSAKIGDILFAGDAIKAEGTPSTFLFCPGKTSQSLAPGAEAILDAKAIKMKTGALTGQKPVAACFLPQMVRVAAASQQHYGISMTRGLGDSNQATAEDKLPDAVKAELAPINAALAADPKDMAAIIAKANLFEKNNLLHNALAEYKKIGTEWKDATWVRRQIFDIEEKLSAQAAAKTVQEATDARIFAVVVGVSQYQKLPQDLWLNFAHKDAETFGAMLQSPRGGGVPKDQVMVLTNEKATTAALRTAFQTFFKSAGKKDTIMILIAGHGTVENPGSKGAFILTHDADPQDLTSTALPMGDVQKLLEDQMSKVGRAILFVDACRSGTIGTIKSTTINSVVQTLAEAEGEIFGLMASRPKELSYEGAKFGGGHGAFTYALLKAMNGDGDKDGNGIVDVNELIKYVGDAVAEGTEDKQHPRDFGTMDNKVPLSYPKKDGIQLAYGRPVMLDLKGEPVLLASAAQAPLPQQDPEPVRRFREALAAGRVLPDTPGSAFEFLKPMKAVLSPESFLLRENELRVALEDRGQQVLLRYLAGDAVPQTRQDFASGGEVTLAATRLTPESLYLEGREAFFRGRTLLFDKKYAEATTALEKAVDIDPGGAYSYNALGIAYLEQADFARAGAAFRDAAKKAPHWAYPLHNLALTYTQTGNYDGAVKAYQEAMRRSPKAAYLPYNLGLVHQKLNRRKEAETAYRRAMALAPDSGEPLNALGALKASTGKSAEAEQLYRDALAKNPKLLPAKHNLALLLAAKPDRRGEAVGLWKENLAQQSDHLPSRLSLAETYAAQGDTKAALAEYREVLRIRPEYAAARLASADLLLKTNDAAGAAGELRTALKTDAENPLLLERLGDAEAAAGRKDEARKAYEAALQQTSEGDSRKRLRKKLN